jgi:hypothetical protein
MRSGVSGAIQRKGRGCRWVGQDKPVVRRAAVGSLERILTCSRAIWVSISGSRQRCFRAVRCGSASRSGHGVARSTRLPTFWRRAPRSIPRPGGGGGGRRRRFSGVVRAGSFRPPLRDGAAGGGPLDGCDRPDPCDDGQFRRSSGRVGGIGAGRPRQHHRPCQFAPLAACASVRRNCRRAGLNRPRRSRPRPTRSSWRTPMRRSVSPSADELSDKVTVSWMRLAQLFSI